MQIETAIQQYLIALKERAPRDRVEFDLTVLARLQEYLEGDSSVVSAEAVQGSDLLEFVRDWYRAGEDIDREVVEHFVGAVLSWAEWLDTHLEAPAGGASRLGLLATLEEALPRTAEAQALLQQHVRDEPLSEEIPVDDEETGSSFGTVTAGLTRVIEPEGVDYSAAEADTFQVLELTDERVLLQSPTRQALGDGPVPLAGVPAAVVRLLRVGDILHGEIAPTPAGWVILHIQSIYPGELDDRS
jgi:hypothetical protein